MAFSEIYVDPSIAADSGAGTIGDPYGDLEYAIEQTTFDTTNGTRVNIKAGTDEVLVSTITAAMADTATSIAWVPSATAPMVLQGYTSSAADGGIGGIDCNGGTVTTGSGSQLRVIDMHCHNSSTADMFSNGGFCSFINCEINNALGIGIDALSGFCTVVGCYLHDIATFPIRTSGWIAYNYIDGILGAKAMDSAIVLITSSVGIVYRNIIAIDGTTDGIRSAARQGIINNSIWSNGGTGQGIQFVGSNLNMNTLTNNIVEGFSGSGGIGYDLTGTSNLQIEVYGSNAAYNNATEYNDPEYIFKNFGDNETLSASPFTDAANGDFSPVDTGNVKEGSLPAAWIDGGSVNNVIQTWKGAVEPAAPKAIQRGFHGIGIGRPS